MNKQSRKILEILLVRPFNEKDIQRLLEFSEEEVHTAINDLILKNYIVHINNEYALTSQGKSKLS